MIFRQIKIEKFNSEINKNNKVANFNQPSQLENFKHEK